MRYWYDWEFVERGPFKATLPLSVGIVAEDDREFYAQFMDGVSEALFNPWMRDNVLPRLTHFESTYDAEKNTAHIQICQDHEVGTGDCPWLDYRELGGLLQAFMRPESFGKPELWGYFADYDHVLLAQAFGRMIDLPKGFPMYTLDVKQLAKMLGDPELPTLSGGLEHNALHDARETKYRWEFLRNQARRLPQDDIGELMLRSLEPTLGLGAGV